MAVGELGRELGIRSRNTNCFNWETEKSKQMSVNEDDVPSKAEGERYGLSVNGQ